MIHGEGSQESKAALSPHTSGHLRAKELRTHGAEDTTCVDPDMAEAGSPSRVDSPGHDSDGEFAT